jgi:hypothetical protein
MPFRKLTSRGYTVIRLSPTYPKGGGDFYPPPPGQGIVRGGGNVQLWAFVGAVCGGAVSGCAGFYAVYE